MVDERLLHKEIMLFYLNAFGDSLFSFFWTFLCRLLHNGYFDVLKIRFVSKDGFFLVVRLRNETPYVMDPIDRAIPNLFSTKKVPSFETLRFL
jgi:hypothetical protein